jgi:hypothetical protein
MQFLRNAVAFVVWAHIALAIAVAAVAVLALVLSSLP